MLLNAEENKENVIAIRSPIIAKLTKKGKKRFVSSPKIGNLWKWSSIAGIVTIWTAIVRAKDCRKRLRIT